MPPLDTWENPGPGVLGYMPKVTSGWEQGYNLTSQSDAPGSCC